MIRLAAPRHNPRGPDGQGWNRLAILAPDPQPQCALRPQTYQALVESDRGSRFATYGHYGRCQSSADCRSCGRRPAAAASPAADQVLVRLDEQERPWLMNRPDRGWAEYGELTTFAALSQMPDFRPAERYRDAHGEGFWMRRSA